MGEPNMLGNSTVPTLALLVMQKLSEDSAAVTQDLISSYQREVTSLRAELEMVRGRVEGLLTGSYQPSSAAIIAALYPTQDVIEEYATYLGDVYP